MATTARLGIDITATDRSRAAFASTQRSVQNIERSVRQLKGAFAGVVGGNLLSGLVRSLVDINKHVEPVRGAFTTLHRAWQAFALQVGQGGLNDALVKFIDTMSKMIVGSSRLSDILGRTLAGVINGMRRTFEALGRTIGFVYDNFEILKKLLITFVAIQIAQRIFTMAQTFIKLALAVRTAALVMGVYHMIAHRTLITMAGMAAIGAKVTGTFEDLKSFMGDVWKTAEELVPVLGGKLLEAMNALGINTSAFTEDFDKFGDALKRLPPTFDEIERGAKAMKPFKSAIMDLKQYVQGINDQTAAVGMSEGALARLAASQEFYNKMQDKGIKLTAAQRAEAEALLNQIPEAITKLNEQRSNLEMLQDIGQSFADAFTSGFTAIVDGSKSVTAAIKDMAKQLIASLTQIFMNKAFDVLLNGPGGSGGIIGSAFGTLFGGKRERGGPVESGKHYLVGERGPEIFAPTGSGTIIPNRGGGGGGGVTIIDQRANGANIERRKDSRGNQVLVLRDAIRSEIADFMGGEKGDKLMGLKYGLSPRTARR